MSEHDVRTSRCDDQRLPNFRKGRHLSIALFAPALHRPCDTPAEHDQGEDDRQHAAENARPDIPHPAHHNPLSEEREFVTSLRFIPLAGRQRGDPGDQWSALAALRVVPGRAAGDGTALDSLSSCLVSRPTADNRVITTARTVIRPDFSTSRNLRLRLTAEDGTFEWRHAWHRDATTANTVDTNAAARTPTTRFSAIPTEAVRRCEERPADGEVDEQPQGLQDHPSTWCALDLRRLRFQRPNLTTPTGPRQYAPSSGATTRSTEWPT